MAYDIGKGEQISFKTLYLMIGILGAILPFLDVWKCGWHVPPSISESYYLGAIVPFVVIMGSLGIVFFCNKGYDTVDGWCNRIAGIAALGVISFPCDSPKYLANIIPYPGVHYVSAVILFLTFAYMCIFVFTELRSDKGWTKQKHIRNIIYRICGVMILAGMGIAYKNTFWGEAWMTEFFAIGYLLQGRVAFKDK